MVSHERARRVPVRCPIRLYDGKRTVEAELRNLSAGGAFVAVDPPIPLGTGLSFRVSLGSGEPVVLQGHVRWTRSLPGPGGEPVGIGLSFADLDEAAAEAVRACLA